MSRMSRNTSTALKLPCTTKGKCSTSMQWRREACRQVRQVLLVEGYMDLLAFHANDFFRVAATLGTALTSQQVRLLSRMCDEVVLAYDGDEAGERAILRALPLFLQEELSVSCIRFPDGLDPDDFLKRFGLSEARASHQAKGGTRGLYGSESRFAVGRQFGRESANIFGASARFSVRGGSRFSNPSTCASSQTGFRLRKK